MLTKKQYELLLKLSKKPATAEECRQCFASQFKKLSADKKIESLTFKKDPHSMPEGIYTVTELGQECMQEYEAQERIIKITKSTFTISLVAALIALITLIVSIASCSKSAPYVIYSGVQDSSGYYASSQQ